MWACPVAQLVKNPPAMVDSVPGFNPWVGKIPWRRERLPTPVFCPGECHGLYPWGHKESDTTERLSLYLNVLPEYRGHPRGNKQQIVTVRGKPQAQGS